MSINKLFSQLSIGALLVTLVTVTANPAYAKNDVKGNNKKVAVTEQPSSDAGSTASENPFRSCSTNNVTGATDCTISNLFNQDSVSPNKPLTVNQGDGFFNYTDWMFGGKIGNDRGYNGNAEGQSGKWNLSNVIQNNWDDIMLVFKSGNGTNLVGYKLKDGVDNGIWNSPYKKDVSHISVYYREGKKPVTRKVPESSSILGLVAGATVVASSLKRKRKSSNTEMIS